ncbi:hypothetical protein D3C73_1193850 [compost metagenome]
MAGSENIVFNADLEATGCPADSGGDAGPFYPVSLGPCIGKRYELLAVLQACAQLAGSRSCCLRAVIAAWLRLGLAGHAKRSPSQAGDIVSRADSLSASVMDAVTGMADLLQERQDRRDTGHSAITAPCVSSGLALLWLCSGRHYAIRSRQRIFLPYCRLCLELDEQPAGGSGERGRSQEADGAAPDCAAASATVRAVRVHPHLHQSN